VGVDEVHGFCQVGHAHATEYWAEDFFFIDAHLWRDVVKQSAAHPETIFATFARRCAIKMTAVHQQVGAFFYALLDVTSDALVRNVGHDGAHFCGEVFAVEHFQSLGALNQLRHQTVCHIAYQNSHADGHAALAS
jgi:hypothetical protein